MGGAAVPSGRSTRTYAAGRRVPTSPIRGPARRAGEAQSRGDPALFRRDGEAGRQAIRAPPTSRSPSISRAEARVVKSLLEDAPSVAPPRAATTAMMRAMMWPSMLDDRPPGSGSRRRSGRSCAPGRRRSASGASLRAVAGRSGPRCCAASASPPDPAPTTAETRQAPRACKPHFVRPTASVAVYEQGIGLPDRLLPRLSGTRLFIVGALPAPALAAAGSGVLPGPTRLQPHRRAPEGRRTIRTPSHRRSGAGMLDALGIRKTVFCGHGWGNMVVWQMALMHPGASPG